MVYDPLDKDMSQLFTKIEKVQDWLYVINLYCNNQPSEALMKLKELLNIDHYSSYEDYLKHNINTLLDINMNSTYCGFNVIHGSYAETEVFFYFIKHKLEENIDFNNKFYLISIYLRVAFNHLSVLFDQGHYNPVITLSKEVLALTKKERIGGESSQFHFLIEVSKHKLSGQNIEKIKETFILFEYEHKAHLIDGLIHHLADYGIEVER